MEKTVTHVPGLECHPCPRTVPTVAQQAIAQWTASGDAEFNCWASSPDVAPECRREAPTPDVASYVLLNRSTSEISVSTNLEALEAEVLKLTPADRSRLLERLIASLDADPEVEEAWEREADRREAELESGAVVAVPGPEAMARLRSRLPR